MNGIGGTFKWSHKQIQAYARAFREGDAVKVGGEWYEVARREVAGVHPGDVHAARPKVNPYNLNYRRDGDVYYEGVARSFLESWVDSPHEVVTPKDYDVQEGDKLVWLGDTSNSRTFGWMYNVVESEDGRLVYLNNKQNRRSADSESLCGGAWGVIPRYENVKEENSMDNKNEHSENTRTFKVGDVVKVSGTESRFDGCVGKVDNVHEARDEFRYHATFGDGDNCWLDAGDLELVDGAEKSPEQEAFEYLLKLDKTLVRIFLTDEINDWAKEYMKQKDYNSAKRAIEILEKLEKGE